MALAKKCWVETSSPPKPASFQEPRWSQDPTNTWGQVREPAAQFVVPWMALYNHSGTIHDDDFNPGMPSNPWAIAKKGIDSRPQRVKKG